MKRINLVKYGFVRWPEEDFTDDGNRFICYRAGKAVRVSKLVADGQAYLSIDSSCGNGTLPFEIYTKLPYYKEANWTYNGVSVESLTDEDIQKFYEACISYEIAYEQAEANIVYPTLEEITAQCEKLTGKAEAEYKKASQLVVEAVLDGYITKLSDYEITEVRKDLKTLQNAIKAHDPKTYPQKIYRKSSSFDFIKPTNYHLNNKSFYLDEIEKFILKAKN